MKKIISFEKKIDFPTMIGEITSISLDHTLKFIDESNVEGEFLITGTYKLTEASRLEEKFDFKVQADILLNETLDLDTTKIDIDDFYYEIENDDTMICHIDVKIEGVEKIEEDIDNSPDILSEESGENCEDETLKNFESNLIEDNSLNNTKESEISTEESIKDNEEENFERSKMEEIKIQEEIRTEQLIKEEVNKKEDRECDGDYPNTEGIKKDMEIDNMSEQNDKRDEMPEVGSLFSSFKDADETFSSYSVYIVREEETIQTLIEKYKTTKEELESYNDLSNLTIGSKIIIPSRNE